MRRKAPDATIDQFTPSMMVRGDSELDTGGASVLTARVVTPGRKRTTWRFEAARRFVFVHTFTRDADGQPDELAETGRYKLMFYAGEHAKGKALGQFVLEVVPRRGGSWSRAGSPRELMGG